MTSRPFAGKGLLCPVRAGALAATLLAPGASAAQTVLASGNEQVVNVTTVGQQTKPQVACIDDGRCVVVWSSAGQDGDGDGVFARLYSSLGAPASGEIPVNETTTGNQGSPSVCMDSTGGFTVAWTGNGTGDATGVYLRRFGPLGTPAAGEVRANTTTTDGQSGGQVACADDGRAIVAWHSTASPAGSYAQRFGSTGLPAGGETRLDEPGGFYWFYGIAALADGSFMVVWNDLAGIMARLFTDTAVAAAPAFTVAEPPLTYAGGAMTITTSLANPRVERDGSGDYVVGWTEAYAAYSDDPLSDWSDPGNLSLKRYDSGGNELAATPRSVESGSDIFGSFMVWFSPLGSLAWDAPTGPAVAAGGSGALVAWDTYGGQDVWASVSSGDLLGFPYQGTGLNQDMIGWRSAPTAAYSGDDHYLVAWVANDEDGAGIVARRLCADTDSDGLCGSADPCPGDADDDADADGICGDTDVCPAVPDPVQADSDADLVGDACEACQGSNDADDADDDGIPDGCDWCSTSAPQLAPGARLVMKGIDNGVPGDDTLKLTGAFPVNSGVYPADPTGTGARIRILSHSGAILEEYDLPAGAYGGSGTAGWVEKRHGSQYLDTTGSPVGGISKATVGGKIKISARRGDFAITAADLPLSITVGGDTPGGDGTCTQLRFEPGACVLDAAVARLTCRE